MVFFTFRDQIGLIGAKERDREYRVKLDQRTGVT